MINQLLESLARQTKKPDEIVIVDGGSTDATVAIITKSPAFAKASAGTANIKFTVSKGATIARGRNIAVKQAKYDIIAMTDAGCVADERWLERITRPLIAGEASVVAGFYRMTTNSPFQKSLAHFLGVMPEKFDEKFLPSTRSIAFTKTVWQKVGWFNEKLTTAEDTDFNYKLALAQARIVRVKNAIVECGIPDTIWGVYKKFFNYAKGDAETKILWNPAKGLMSHNIKVLFIFMRYLAGLALLGLGLGGTSPLSLFIFLVLAYLFWAYKKAGFWGVIIQPISDLAVMSGAISGILGV